jgi:MYXO-CTERM domain-containing protein
MEIPARLTAALLGIGGTQRATPTASFTVTGTSSAPEPEPAFLFGLSLLGLLFTRRGQRRVLAIPWVSGRELKTTGGHHPSFAYDDAATTVDAIGSGQ